MPRPRSATSTVRPAVVATREPDVDRRAGAEYFRALPIRLVRTWTTPHRVAVDRHGLGRAAQRARAAVGAEVAGGAAGQRDEVGAPIATCAAAVPSVGGDPRREQQVLDQPGQVLGAVADDLEALGAASPAVIGRRGGAAGRRSP